MQLCNLKTKEYVMNEQDKTTEISLSFLWAVLRHRWLPLLLALVVGAGAMFTLT